MANKRYDEFPAGTPDAAKITLQADATTGALEKIPMFAAAGSDTEIQINTGNQLSTDSNLSYDGSTGAFLAGLFEAGPGGVLIINLTSAQIAALTGVNNGTLVFNSTIFKLQVFAGSWQTITSV